MIPIIIPIASASAVYLSLQKHNASREIKEANKALASMQMNKMAAKTGILGDKVKAYQQHNHAYNAYLVGATSYNITDSVNIANQLAIKRITTLQDNILLMICLLSFIYALVFINTGIAILTFTIGLITFTIKEINRIPMLYLISGISSLHLLALLFTILITMVEQLPLNKDTRTLRYSLYTILICLIIV